MTTPQTVIIQILDDDGGVAQSHTVDVHGISPAKIAMDAYKEFGPDPDLNQYVRIIDESGNELYNDYPLSGDDEYPSEEEIFAVEYEESLKYEDWEL